MKKTPIVENSQTRNDSEQANQYQLSMWKERKWNSVGMTENKNQKTSLEKTMTKITELIDKNVNVIIKTPFDRVLRFTSILKNIFRAKNGSIKKILHAWTRNIVKIRIKIYTAVLTLKFLLIIFERTDSSSNRMPMTNVCPNRSYVSLTKKKVSGVKNAQSDASRKSFFIIYMVANINPT